ncbi:MAG: outer-membrane lipoprotein carrier protein LolA [Prosthecobacter sp.]
MLRLFLAIVLCAHASAQTPELLTQWVAAQKNLPDMHVPFRMTRAVPTLKEPASSRGNLYRLKDGRFRLEVGQPPTSVILFDGESMHAREDEKKGWHTLPPTHRAARMWTLFLHPEGMSVEAITRDFTPSLTDQSDTVSTVTLKPKSAILRRHLLQIDIQIHRPTNRLLQMRVAQADRSTVTLSFDPPESLTAGQQSRLVFTPPPSS